MAELKIALGKILKWEGGYANDPDDTGGETMKGVTLTTYKQYCKVKGLPTPTSSDLKSITYDTIYDLADTLFWSKIKGNEIVNQSIANLCMDSVWGSGTGYIKKIQEVLGTSQDGVVGPNTLKLINEWDPQSDLHQKLWERRAKFFQGCSTYWKYGNGWMRRLKDYVFEPTPEVVIEIDTEHEIVNESPVPDVSQTATVEETPVEKKSFFDSIKLFIELLLKIFTKTK